MKLKNIVKTFILAGIILSIGFIATIANKLSINKTIEFQDTHKTVEQILGKVLGEVEDIDGIDKNEVVKVDNPTVTHIDKDSELLEEDKSQSASESLVVEEYEPINQEEISEEENKIKEDLEENKDNKNKNNKKDKEDKKDNNNNEDKKDKKSKDDKKEKPIKNVKEDKKIIESKFISEDKAKEIAINKVGDGVKLMKIKSKLNNNPPKYELDLILGSYEYEIEIHAITGAIIDFEKEEIDD